ncbi:MAG TPA: class I SAM-dependent methyltransferase [Candidatus Moranbacteria bacterium]|nr:class I SAM-dependent methyltransferase [Candidatus Moranbacteria bacterium]
MLLNTGVGFQVSQKITLEKIPAVEFDENEVEVVTLSKEDINGECERNNIFVFAFILFFSYFCLIKNSIRIILSWLSNDFGGFWRSLKRMSFEEISKEWERQKSVVANDKNHSSSVLFDKFCPKIREAKAGAARWQSLRLFYRYYEEVEPSLPNDWRGSMVKFWARRIENRQAVTNRFKIVYGLLSDRYKKSGKSYLKIVSIASGSADAVIRSIRDNPEIKFSVTLIDIDQTALDEAKRQVEIQGIKNANFEYIIGEPKKINEVCKIEKADIIEMVGLMDYLSHKVGVKYSSNIKKALCPGGLFLTGNIEPNREELFLHWVFMWSKMKYRRPNQLAEILHGAGFSQYKMVIVEEPLKIHMIAVCVN